MSSNLKNIPVREDTAEQLSDHKGYGDTWDDVVRRLIDE